MKNKYAHSWEGIRFFLAYIRSENIEKTAEKLGVSTATVSRRLKELEEILGRPLLIRHPSGMVMSEGVEELVNTWKVIEQMIDATYIGKLSEGRVITKTISFSTVPSIAHGLLFHHLKAFLDRNPNVNIKIDTSIGVLDFYTSKLDMALRFVRPTKGNLVVQKKGEMSFGAFYSSALGDQETVIQAIKDGKVPFIYWMEQPHNALGQDQSLYAVLSQARTIQINNYSSLLESIETGCGIGIIPHLVGHRLSKVSSLSKDMFYSKTDLWLVTEKNALNYPHIREFKDFISSLFEEHRNLFVV